MNIEIIRHQILKNMREYLYQKGYIEVFSPILRKSDSKINPRFRLNNDGFLRDCMELALRKKVSKSCPKVFEIGPCFRQEKEDRTHNVEFYLMELYSKEEILENMMELMSGIIIACVPTVSDIKEISVQDFIQKDLNVDIVKSDTGELVNIILDKHHHVIKKEKYPYLTVNKYIELFIESSLTDRGCLYFLTDYPLCTIAVASRQGNTNCIRRFECFINGMEIANAFEDCMDLVDLTSRLKESGIMEKEEEELIKLVKSGKVFPTVGLGIGIDRLCILMI